MLTVAIAILIVWLTGFLLFYKLNVVGHDAKQKNASDSMPEASSFKKTREKISPELISGAHCDFVDGEQISFVDRPRNLEITQGNRQESPRNKRNCLLDVSRNDTFDLSESDTLPASQSSSINNNSGQKSSPFDVQIARDLQNVGDRRTSRDDCYPKSLLFQRTSRTKSAANFALRKRKVSDMEEGDDEMLAEISNANLFSRNTMYEIEQPKQSFDVQSGRFAASGETFSRIRSKIDSSVENNGCELLHVDPYLAENLSNIPCQSILRDKHINSPNSISNLFPVKSPLESVILKNRIKSFSRREPRSCELRFNLDSLTNYSRCPDALHNSPGGTFDATDADAPSEEYHFEVQRGSFEQSDLYSIDVPSQIHYSTNTEFSTWHPVNPSSSQIFDGCCEHSSLEFSESVRTTCDRAFVFDISDEILQCNNRFAECSPDFALKAEGDDSCEEETQDACSEVHELETEGKILTEVLPQRPTTLNLKKSSSCGTLSKIANLDYSGKEKQSFLMSFLEKRKVVPKLPSPKSLSSIDDCSSSVSSITKLLLTSTSTQLTETPTTPPFTKSLFSERKLERIPTVKVISSKLSNSSADSFCSSDSNESDSTDNTCRSPRFFCGSGSFESTLARTASDESSRPPSPLSAQKSSAASSGNLGTENCTIFENSESESCASSTATQIIKSFGSGKPARPNRIDSSTSISSSSSFGLNRTVYDSLDCQYGKLFPDGSILRHRVSPRRECCSSASSKRSSIEVGDSFRPINYRNFPYIDNSSQGSFRSYLSHTSPESFICLSDKRDLTPSPQTSPRMKQRLRHLSNSRDATPVLGSVERNGSLEKGLNKYLTADPAMLNVNREQKFQNFCGGQFSDRTIEHSGLIIRSHSPVDLDSTPTTARNSIPIFDDAVKEGAIHLGPYGQSEQADVLIQQDNFCAAGSVPYSSLKIAPSTTNHDWESNEQVPSLGEEFQPHFPRTSATNPEELPPDVLPNSEHDRASFSPTEAWLPKPSFSNGSYFSRRKKLKRKRRRLISRLREQDIEQVFQLYFFSDPATSSLSPLCSPFVTPSSSTPASPVTCPREQHPTIFGTVAGDQCPKDSTKRGLPQTPKGSGLRGSHGSQDAGTTPEWATLPDDDNSLVYEDGVLVSGSLQALVQHATPTSSYYPDTAYLFAFLLSSRLFIKPHDLLQRVSDLGFTQQGLQNDDTSAVDKDKLEKFVVHIVQLLGEWSETFPYDFRDERVMSCVRTITHRCIALQPNLRRDVTQILHNLLNKLTHLERYEESLSKHTVAPPADSLSDVPDITEICSSPLVMAQQLTHIELERLSFIGPEEFVQAFAKDSNIDSSYKDLKKTNNLEVYVQWFNKLSYLVATQAVSHLKKKQRVRVIEWWIEVARECFNIGNFNSLMGIIAGLNMSPVSRLKKTWSKVQTAKFSVLEHQMDPTSNFSSYRSTLKAAMWRSAGAVDDRQKIVIPFFSLLVKDLYFLNEGCANRLPNGYINFDKFWQLAKQVTEFMAWKQVTCPFERVPHVINYLQSASILSEIGLAHASFECEGPENSYEKERYKNLHRVESQPSS